MRKTTFKEFVDLLVPKVQELATDYEVKTHMVTKVNDTQYLAITVRKTGDNIAKNIYLEPYFHKYVHYECSLDSLAHQIFDVAVEVQMEYDDCQYIIANMRDYEAIKDYLAIKLINADSNTEYLKDKCYKPLFDTDMVIVFTFLVSHSDDGIGTIVVPKECFEAWDKDIEEVYEYAVNNMQNRFPVIVKPLHELVKSLKEDMDDDFADMMNPPEFYFDDKLLVVTNNSGINGASSLLYPGVLNAILSDCNTDKLVILPSSIHETIVLPLTDKTNLRELKNMVCEVNSTQVQEQEILSYNIFIYDTRDGVIHTWKE